MRRPTALATGFVFAAIVLVALPVSGSASAAPLPAVTVSSGPTTPTFVLPECNDVAEPVDAAAAFVVHRDAPDASPLEVTYTTSGAAESGSDFEPLPGSVTIPANADSATVPVTALLADVTKSVDLTITVSGGAGYTVGDPATVTLALVVRRNPALGPVDCNPSFQLGPEATNHEQTIHVGETPVGITTTGDFVFLRLTDGELPPGISVADQAGTLGEFVGTATTPGDYQSTLDACQVGIVITCRQTTLVVHVLAAAQPPVTDTAVTPDNAQLPVTGTPAPGITIVGVSLLLLGAVMARAGRRRVA
jgi:LPXTG-motif cell wall-anchored protein